MGVVAYAFHANRRVTRNRPSDEHRFQVKYGPDDKKLHEIWQDPYGLYTTLFLGINPELGIFVGADPVLHNPTRMFMSIEFKQHRVDKILSEGWSTWERDRRSSDDPVEVLVGGGAEWLLRYIRFEREALGEDQGHRQLLAERAAESLVAATTRDQVLRTPLPSSQRLHALASEFQLSEKKIMDLIDGAPRLKMAVRGWVAEEHLLRELAQVAEVTDCEQIRKEGGADVSLRFRGRPLTIECKNVLRQTTKDGLARVDLQRTRTSKGDPCSRYYSPTDFNLVAACLHAVTLKWEFMYAPTGRLDPHKSCRGKLSNNVRVDTRWRPDAHDALVQATSIPE